MAGKGRRIDRLFYELQLEVEDFNKGIADAEKSANRFTDYIGKHPLAAVGALGAAITVLGIKAAKMAAEMESAMRKAGSATASELKDATKGVMDLSKESPRAATELAAMFAKARKGAEDHAAALTRLRAATMAADASNADLATVIDGLDNVLDSFNLSSAESEVVLAKLVATSKNKVPLEDLLDVLTKNGAQLKRLGFGLDEAAIRMVALLDAGVPAKQVMTQFAEAGTVATGAMINASDALNTLHREANATREGTEALATILQNQFSAAMTELGTNVLPLVNSELKGMLGLIALLNGTVADIKTDAAVNAINAISKAWDKLTPEGRARDLKRLRESIEQIQKATGVVFGSSTMGAEIGSKMSTDQIEASVRGLDTMAKAGAFTAEQMKGVTASIAALNAELDKRGRTGAPGAKKPAKAAAPVLLSDDQKEMIASAKEALVKLTTTLRDDLELELDKLTKAAAEKFGTDLPNEIIAQLTARKTRITDVVVFEGLDAELDEIETKMQQALDALEAGSADLAFELAQRLQAAAGAIQQQMIGADKTTTTYKEQEAVLKRISALYAKIAGKAMELPDAAKATAKAQAEAVAKATELGRKIENAARGAIDLANAFDLMDDKTAKVLENITQIAAAIPRAMAGDWTAILSIAGGAAQLFSGLTGGGSFGDAKRANDRASEERRIALEKEHAAVLKNLNEVLRQYAKTVGDLGRFDVSGSDFTKTRSALQSMLDAIERQKLKPTDRLMRSGPDADQLLEKMTGMNIAELTRALEALGIHIDLTKATVAEFTKAFEALRAVELAQFADSFTGQLEALRAQFELFDITDPIAQLKKLQEVFADPKFGAPALSAALAGLDLTSAEGREAARKNIQDLFSMLQSGGFAGNEAALGGLTAQQFLEQLLEVNRLLTTGQGGATGTTSQFSVERKITDVQADRMLAYMSTGNAILEQMLAAEQLMSSYLEQLVHPPITVNPPSMSAINAMPGVGGAGLQIGELHVHTAATDPQGVADAIADTLVALVSQKLEAQARTRAKSGGATMVS